MPIEFTTGTTTSTASWSSNYYSSYNNNYYQFYSVDEYGNKYFEHDPWAPEPKKEEPEELTLWDLI